MNQFFLFFRFTKWDHCSKSLPNLTFEMPWTKYKYIYIWGIFSAEVYPRSSIAIQRTVRMSWISCPLNDLQMGQQVQNPRDCA